MKILSAKQIHEWDAYTIQHEGITSLELMERAASRCVQFIIENYTADTSIKIFCGKGNNGGDGLAVARLLTENNYSVSVYILEIGSAGSDDFEHNLQLLPPNMPVVFYMQSANDLPALTKQNLIIDALYGSGLNRPLKDTSATLVQHINESKATVISIDLPSGMYADKSCKNEAVINADITLTFQCLKLCFLMVENAVLFGKVHVFDIGLDAAYLKNIETDISFSTKHFIQSFYTPRKEFVNKGTFGHALLIAGNVGKMGAAIMSARACLRSGAGLLTVNVPEALHGIIHTSLPEAMCSVREENVDLEKIKTIGIGPGIGTKDASIDLLKKVLQSYNQPMIVDADALNIIAASKQLLALIPADSIITPHPKEFERLFGESDNDFERMHCALQQSATLPLVIILKGTYTLIAYKGKGWFNTTGNSGLAKGGSGDILTGVLTALLSQHYTSLNAALLGVYLHGLAADITLQTQSKESMLATDVIENIGEAFKQLS